ncbi:VanZ family protein [Litoribacillus peritrichatus]|uniref:VanZ-like domain-containing protein n=1 Tax=Litoribacillus peritrichatus TaxID=718191 RepID=A0ABP7MR69_9GAMM
MKWKLFATAFFGFICWVIYLADSGKENIFLVIVHAIPYGDKVGHAVLYGLLAFLMNMAFNMKSMPPLKVKPFRNVILPMGAVLVFLFAFLEELTQMYFPNRTFDGGDLIADFVGITLFSWFSVKVHTAQP